MTDYTELVKALRGLANGIWKNSEYTWFGGEEKVFADAAAAIDGLVESVPIRDKHLDELNQYIWKLEAEAKRLKECNDELREAQTYIDHYGDKWLTSAKDVPTSAYNHGYMDGKNEAEQALEPKRGEWIDRYDEDDKPFFKRKYVCSACGGWNTYGKSKYCPKCGAKMMEVQE